MHFLLSPAKNLNEKTAPPFSITPKLPPFLAQSDQIARVLVNKTADELQDLMNISAKIAAQNVARNRAWHIPFEPESGAKPAVYLFDGDAYKGLNAYELTQNEIQYLAHHLSILSGLYGLLSPLDLILPYRLEMGTKLAVGTSANLYEFWADTLTAHLQKILDNKNDTVLVNLASSEYFGALHPQKLRAHIITPKFLDYKNGQYKIISMYAKRARGMMVRFCAVNAIQNPDQLKTFDMEGYFFDATQSDDTTFVFKRKALEQ